MKVLVISPHADDELFGCGGTLLRLKEQGCIIKCVLVACSDIHMHHNGLVKSEERANEFIESCRLLSTEIPSIYYMRDSHLDKEPLSSLVTKLDFEIDSFKPSMMFIPEPSYHQDHQYVYKACIASLRPTKDFLPSQILAYEVPTNTWHGMESPFKPNVYYKLSYELVERKKFILQNVYSSQVVYENERGQLSLNAIERHTAYRGIESNGYGHAEAFMLLKELR